MRPIGRKDQSIDLKIFLYKIVFVWFLWLLMWLLFNDAYFILVPSFLLFKWKNYFNSVNCDKEFWSLSSDSVTAWLDYTQAFSV